MIKKIIDKKVCFVAIELLLPHCLNDEAATFGLFIYGNKENHFAGKL